MLPPTVVAAGSGLAPARRRAGRAEAAAACCGGREVELEAVVLAAAVLGSRWATCTVSRHPRPLLTAPRPECTGCPAFTLLAPALRPPAPAGPEAAEAASPRRRSAGRAATPLVLPPGAVRLGGAATGPRSSATAASKSCEVKLDSCTFTQLGETSMEGETDLSMDHSRAEGDLSEDAVLTDVQEGDL
mmetsp:Transcript_55121/g.171220  ORF Transcript_55121/g.171220 Transcript_55121/m.171220 type:complete len:188 (-) Transcript_55121:627-1190(-)